MKSPLWDKDFLKLLDENRDREIYARIIALSFDEEPIEKIEGLVTTGSINIDGSSAVCRTCSLSLVANNLDINDYYWGLKSKFKLEIGLKNTIGAPYGNLDIIWFPQGTYAITAFNTSYSTTAYNISISGKDKMCFLNGDLGGNLTASIDFGTEEYYDKATNTTTYTDIPIETIIREGVHTYAKEPYHNIIINDLDDISVELLEYRGDTPLYLLRLMSTNEDNGAIDQFVNFTDNGSVQVKFADSPNSGWFALEDLETKGGQFDRRVELNADITYERGSKLIFYGDNNRTYTVAKLEYGQTAGYRYTDLTYAGDLISSIGEAFTSILDKIKTMLGEFEYFYDLDGRFVFQKKKTYTQTSWNNIVKVGDNQYIDSAAYTSAVSYKFEDANLITSFQNNPSLTNLKNDYSVWGERETVSGAKVPVHYRYAIDQKPSYYKTFSGDVYYTDEYDGEIAKEDKLHDWRELIYQMALDYYKYHEQDDYEVQLKENNPETCFKGITGYEQYYTDMQGFWRQLYDPNPDVSYAEYEESVVKETFKSDSNLRVQDRYLAVEADINNYENIWALIYHNNRYELHPWIDVVYLPNYYGSGEASHYYRQGPNGTYYQITDDKIKARITKSELYYLKDGISPEQIFNDNQNDAILPLKETTLFNYYYNNKTNQKESIIGYYQFQNDGKYYIIDNQKTKEDGYEYLDNKVSQCYCFKDGNNDVYYYKYLNQSRLDIDGKQLESNNVPIQFAVRYFGTYYSYVTDEENNWCYWTKDIIENPSSLNFWFDFMDANSELGQYSIPAIGDRTKVVNDNKVTSIYFRQVPQLIFTTRKEWQQYDQQDSGYTVVFMNGSLENMFKISSQGKSAQDKLDELLYSNTYCIESVTIQTVPIYYLQPNTRIFVRDDNTKINGEYIVSKISLPLSYNGTMSITATKAPEGIKIS